MTGDLRDRAIFVSYRREDSEGEAGRLFDDLVRALGEDSVFMDVAGIQFGRDFRKAIDENVTCCGVLLAIVGPRWTSITDVNGVRRLDNANDFVRLEIASALARDIPVIPVLVHGAAMPHADQLPDNLKDLSYRNSIELTHARWNSDVALLINALKKYVNVRPEREAETTPPVPVQTPLPQALPAVSPARKSRYPLVGIGALVVVALAVGMYFTTSTKPPPPQQVSSTLPQKPAGSVTTAAENNTPSSNQLSASQPVRSPAAKQPPKPSSSSDVIRSKQLPAPQPSSASGSAATSESPATTPAHAAAPSGQPSTQQLTTNSQTTAQPAQSAVPDAARSAQPSVPQPPVMSPAAAALVGKWQNPTKFEMKSNTDALVQIAVAESGSQLIVRAWGVCPRGLCDWGTVPAMFNGTAAVTGAFAPRFVPLEVESPRTVTLVLHSSPEGLQVTVRNSYQDPRQGLRENDRTYMFLRVGVR